MNGYSFTKASSNGFEVSIAIEVYHTSLPSFFAPSMSADCEDGCAERTLLATTSRR